MIYNGIEVLNKFEFIFSIFYYKIEYFCLDFFENFY